MLSPTIKRPTTPVSQHFEQATGWDSILGRVSNHFLKETRFPKLKEPPKTIATRRATRSKVRTDDLQVLGTTIQNVFARDLSILWLRSLHPYTSYFRDSHYNFNTGVCGAYLQYSEEWEEHVSVR
jgi:hypothetical protein